MPQGLLLWIGRGNAVMAPVGVMRPMRLKEYSVNHRLPSGPATISLSSLLFPSHPKLLTLPPRQEAQ